MNDLILGLQLTILGMGMVLFILSLLYLAVTIQGWIVNRETGASISVPEQPPETNEAPETAQAAEAQPEIRDERERVAAVTAAVAAYRQLRRRRSIKSPYMVPYT